ncbi:MAG: hypothetical protein E7311_02790 [Clostridiales bacterium]|nr:hypothetical protein [Clostridiales bacterium]
MIDKINNLLNNDDELLKYIDEIEEKNIQIDTTLEQDLFENISIIQNIIKKEKTKKKYTFIDYMKVACFTAVTVMTWEIGIAKISNIQIKEENEISIESQEEFTDNKFSEFLMGEIIKGGEE